MRDVGNTSNGHGCALTIAGPPHTRPAVMAALYRGLLTHDNNNSQVEKANANLVTKVKIPLERGKTCTRAKIWLPYSAVTAGKFQR